MDRAQDPVVVIGAGLGGLAAALRLAHAGRAVTVLEAAATPGGKMRTVPSPAGPVDAGPTVLTQRAVFEQLFTDVGASLIDHVTLHREPLLARHYWPDGSTLDLWDDADRSADAIGAFSGAKSAAEFQRFHRETAQLYDAFEAPVMEAPAPTLGALTSHVLRQPRLIPAMAPLSTMAKRLAKQFSDPRLRQLFGRYATYVGGSPFASPALLSLIWQSEFRGVWRVEGGMHRLARAIATLAQAKGATFHYETPAARIETQDGEIAAVISTSGQRFATQDVVFAGDPQALAQGLLGTDVTHAVAPTGHTPRSLSAWVHAFAGKADGPELAHHTVFFGADPATEFDPIAKGALPRDPTLYVCAEDRGTATTTGGVERFEIIMNGAPTSTTERPPSREIDACQTLVFDTLSRHGLTFDPRPGPEALTTPADFHRLFPGSDGSLYGRSPHGMLAAFQRPVAQTPLPGLVLAGGGVHPGAGIPMATRSGKHAAEAILKRPASTLMSRQTATPGGMSTVSANAATEPSA